MTKRIADNDLNHNNWDQEEESEEPGEFVPANNDILGKRVLKVAKRRLQDTNSTAIQNEGKPNPFSVFTFGSTSSVPPKNNTAGHQSFDFLHNIVAPNKTLTSSTGGYSTSTTSPPSTFNFKQSTMSTSAPPATTSPHPAINFSFTSTNNTIIPSNSVKTTPTSTDLTGDTSSSGDKQEELKKCDNNAEYYARLKGLNECVLSWISKHVERNPLINLQPIFKNYDKYFMDLEEQFKAGKEAVEHSSQKTNISSNRTSDYNTSSTSPQRWSSMISSSDIFSTTLTTSSSTGNSSASNRNKEDSAGSMATTVTVNQSSQPSPLNSFSFGAASTSFFPPTERKLETAAAGAQDEEDATPPKVEFIKVEEQGHVHTVRCKMFVKKDGAFVDKGVGNLYIKPIPETGKYQVIVRAETNLGNLLCNFVLSEMIPMQRSGAKDVLLVCVPVATDTQPVPTLFRVKTAEEAATLLAQLQQYKK